MGHIEDLFARFSHEVRQFYELQDEDLVPYVRPDARGPHQRFRLRETGEGFIDLSLEQPDPRVAPTAAVARIRGTQNLVTYFVEGLPLYPPERYDATFSLVRFFSDDLTGEFWQIHTAYSKSARRGRLPAEMLLIYRNPKTMPKPFFIHVELGRKAAALSQYVYITPLGPVYITPLGPEWETASTVAVRYIKQTTPAGVLRYFELPTFEDPASRFRRVLSGSPPLQTGTRVFIPECPVTGAKFHLKPWTSVEYALNHLRVEGGSVPRGLGYTASMLKLAGSLVLFALFVGALVAHREAQA